MTGYWPYQLISQWNSPRRPGSHPGRVSGRRGYLTAGFSGNTSLHLRDQARPRLYPFRGLSTDPAIVVEQDGSGSWLLENVLYRDDFYELKWIRLHPATGRDQPLVSRLAGPSARDRPFFAYFNYFDAHEPYMPPESYAGRFGIRPRLSATSAFLLDYASPGSSASTERDLVMARDCYDDCIAFLDDQLGQLLDRLEGPGALENTLVILASDHGEWFGDRASFTGTTPP